MKKQLTIKESKDPLQNERPDYNYWAKLDSWSITEAAFLLAFLDPRFSRLNPNNVSKSEKEEVKLFRKQYQIAWEYRTILRRNFFIVHPQCGAITAKNILKLALEKKIPIPNPLKKSFKEILEIDLDHPEAQALLLTPLISQTHLESNKQKTPKENALDKAAVQAVAKCLWDQDNHMTIVSIEKHKWVQIFANGAQYKGKHTLRDWIKEVDPRKPEDKTGRPKKTPV